MVQCAASAGRDRTNLVKIKRTPDGRWLPGQSANPTGKARITTAGLALSETIRKATQEGAELAEIALEIARNEQNRPADRLDAIEYLTTRGFGKPSETTSLETEDGTMIGVGVKGLPLKNFSDEQLRQMLREAQARELISE